jgi:hypothetical protein
MWEQVDQAYTRKDELALLADLEWGLEIGHCNSLRLSIELFGTRLEGWPISTATSSDGTSRKKHVGLFKRQ